MEGEKREMRQRNWAEKGCRVWSARNKNGLLLFLGLAWKMARKRKRESLAGNPRICRSVNVSYKGNGLLFSFKDF